MMMLMVMVVLSVWGWAARDAVCVVSHSSLQSRGRQSRCVMRLLFLFAVVKDSLTTASTVLGTSSRRERSQIVNLASAVCKRESMYLARHDKNAEEEDLSESTN